MRVRLHLDRWYCRGWKINARAGPTCSLVGDDLVVPAQRGWPCTRHQLLRVERPGLERLELSLGEKAECYRGSLSVLGCKRPVRHLVAVSAELAETRLGAAIESKRTILSDDAPVFVPSACENASGCPSCGGEVVYERLEASAGPSPAGRGRLLAGVDCRDVLIAVAGRAGMLLEVVSAPCISVA